MVEQNTKLGIWLMLATTMVFAVQDGLSRYLAGEYNVYMVIMIRFWFFAAFVIAISARRHGGLRGAARTTQPILQTVRAVLLISQICVMVTAFTILGLVESHAVFAAYPLISALMFALYGLLTRYATRQDTAATSFFWTGTVGSVAMTVIGIWFWQPMIGGDWVWMAVLCVTGVLSHFTLIKCYEVAEASAVQPFAYLQLVFITIIGITVFQETIRNNVAIGVAIVVGAGLFTLWRQRKTA